jgi:FMN-dependent NADH-azoreductase
MSNALVLTSSISGANSVSGRLVERTLDQLRAADAQLVVVRRDLASQPIPHLDADAVAAIRGEPANEAQRAARTLSDALVQELEDADVIVIGAPMYNFGIPTTLKTWFDYVLRPGVTFRYTEAGPQGLLKGKRAIVVLSRGGLYSEGPAQALDSQEPHLRTLLGFMGVSDVAFIRAEKLAFGEDAQRAAIEDANAAIATTVASLAKAA